jgi:hypothetical protein
MKIVAWVVAVSLLVIAVASSCGIVGFRYPDVIDDQPLKDPIRVLSVEGSRLHLADSRTFQCQNMSEKALKDAITQSDFTIDIEVFESTAVVYARPDGWVCGTPWAQPIQIPIFADKVYRNRRVPIAVGEFVSTVELLDPSIAK